MNHTQHSTRVFRSLTKFNTKTWRKGEEARKKPVCPLKLTPLERNMYHFCPRCGEDVRQHK